MLIRIAVFSMLGIFSLFSASGMTRELDLPNGSLTLFAPDWIWQGQTVNLIAVAENRNPATPYSLTVDVVAPSNAGARFSFLQSPHLSTNVVRRQYLLVTAFSPAPDMARGSYDFTLKIAADEWNKSLVYPVSVIRGSLVEAGIWSVLLPTLIALLWSAVLVVILPRFGSKGAWKIIPPSFHEAPDPKEWFIEKTNTGGGQAPAPLSGRHG